MDRTPRNAPTLKQQLLELLWCPACHSDLAMAEAREAAGEVENGHLVCQACGRRYPIVGFVPRFVSSENYASTFGWQWTRFRQTQLDSHSGTTISRDRFLWQTDWSPDALRGALVLDVGCGAGRFAEVVLSFGAEVVAVDYSVAVDACWENFHDHPRLHVVQADVYALPLRLAAFDFLYCFGMLQHTPRPAEAFMQLPPHVKPGGRLAVDLYPRVWTSALHPRMWLRPLTKRVPQERLLAIVQRAVPALLPLSRLAGRVPVIGRALRHLIPVANYDGIYPLSDRQMHDWAVLDTFDWLSPAYDHPQRAEELRRWFEDAGLQEIEVSRRGLLVGRASKPAVAVG